MGLDRLNALANLSTHKDFIAECTDFNKRVIDKFATLKLCQAELLYK